MEPRAGLPILSTFSKPISSNPNLWHGRSKAAENGFPAIAAPNPINVAIKAYAAAQPYNVQIYCPIDGSTHYLNITEFAATTPAITAFFLMTRNRICLKLRSGAMSENYICANVYIDMNEGAVSDVSYEIIGALPTTPGFSSYPCLSDYFVDNGIAWVGYLAPNSRLITIDELVRYPSQGSADVAFGEDYNVKGPFSYGLLKMLTRNSAVSGNNHQSTATSVAAYICRQPFRINEMIEVAPSYSTTPTGQSIPSSAINIGYAKSSPFFSCFNTGGLIKEETDALTVTYTLDVRGPFPI